MAHNKGQRELDFTLAFYVAKITGPRWNIPHTGRDCPASAESWKSRLFIIREVVCVANHAAQSHHRNILQLGLFPLFVRLGYSNTLSLSRNSSIFIPFHYTTSEMLLPCRHFFP